MFQLDVPDPDRGSASNKPTGRDSPGKLAEIDIRHRWAARQRMKELKGPGTWPDIILDKRRRELRLLRRCWIDAGRSTLEIERAIADGGWPDSDGRHLGRIIDFTFADYQTYGRVEGRHPSTIRPIDATQTEIDDYLREFHRPRKREALRQRRAEQAAKRQLAGDLDCRSSAIWTVLTDKSRPLSQIMGDLRGGDAFRKPNDRPLTGNSLRKAILAKLKSRELADRIDITTVTEKHGKPMFLVRRRQS